LLGGRGPGQGRGVALRATHDSVDRFEQFVLLFKVDEPGRPQQGNYTLLFDGEADRRIFLVPVAREGAQVAYEAVFNRVAATA